MKKLVLATMSAVAVAFGLSGSVSAAYPEQPITMIVSYSAGGTTDVMARLIAPYIEKHLGNDASIVVFNKPGAAGEVGFTALALAKPDGYTIGVINVPVLLSIPIERKARYTLDSFDLIANLVDDPGTMNVNVKSEIKSLDDVVAAATKNPGALTIGSGGIGSDDHFSILMFTRLTGTKITHVPFTGGAPNRASLLGGHVAVSTMNVSDSMSFKEAGKIRILGQMSRERSALAPDVPTFEEQGYKVYMGSQRGVAAPKGVPADILAKLEDAIGKAVKDPEFVAAAEKSYMPLKFMPSAEYRKMLTEMDKDLHQLWQEMPWKWKK